MASVQHQRSPLAATRLVVEEWTTAIATSDLQKRRILQLLDKRMLLRRAVKKGVKRINSPRGLRFLFPYHSARVLGWKSRIPEGHPSGFSEAVNTALRTLLWSDNPDGNSQ